MVEKIMSYATFVGWINPPHKFWRIAGALGINLLFISMLYSTLSNWHADWQLAHRTISPLSQRNALSTTKVLAQMADWHLFGVDVSSDFALTNLQLNLMGIIQTVPASASMALIAVAGKPAARYAVGAIVVNNVRIKAILADAVILENANHLEKLPLARPALLFQGLPQPLLGT